MDTTENKHTKQINQSHKKNNVCFLSFMAPPSSTERQKALICI